MAIIKSVFSALAIGLLSAGLSLSATEARAQSQERLQAPAKAYQAGDYFEAHKLWLQLAEEGNRGAYFNLGILNQYGRGVSLDLVEAYKWYLLSAKAGLPAGEQAVVKMRPYMAESDIKEAEYRAERWYSQRPDLRRGGEG